MECMGRLARRDEGQGVRVSYPETSLQVSDSQKALTVPPHPQLGRDESWSEVLKPFSFWEQIGSIILLRKNKCFLSGGFFIRAYSLLLVLVQLWLEVCLCERSACELMPPSEKHCVDPGADHCYRGIASSPKTAAPSQEANWIPLRVTVQISGHKYQAAFWAWTGRFSCILSVYLVLLQCAKKPEESNSICESYFEHQLPLWLRSSYMAFPPQFSSSPKLHPCRWIWCSTPFLLPEEDLAFKRKYAVKSISRQALIFYVQFFLWSVICCQRFEVERGRSHSSATACWRIITSPAYLSPSQDGSQNNSIATCYAPADVPGTPALWQDH